jgi:hypothetical protein
MQCHTNLRLLSALTFDLISFGWRAAKIVAATGTNRRWLYQGQAGSSISWIAKTLVVVPFLSAVGSGSH